MRSRWLLGSIVLLISLTACAGGHEAPKPADLVFPFPWMIKRYQAGTFYQDLPPQAPPPAPPVPPPPAPPVQPPGTEEK
jgi:hypothetical protein